MYVCIDFKPEVTEIIEEKKLSITGKINVGLAVLMCCYKIWSLAKLRCLDVHNDL